MGAALVGLVLLLRSLEAQFLALVVAVVATEQRPEQGAAQLQQEVVMEVIGVQTERMPQRTRVEAVEALELLPKQAATAAPA